MPFLFDEKLIETLLWFEKQQTGGYGMQMEQYENRKNYVESVKNSFASPGKKDLSGRTGKNVHEVFLDFGLCWHFFCF